MWTRSYLIEIIIDPSYSVSWSILAWPSYRRSLDVSSSLAMLPSYRRSLDVSSSLAMLSKGQLPLTSPQQGCFRLSALPFSVFWYHL